MALILANGFEGIGVEDLNKYFDSIVDTFGDLKITQGRNGGNCLSHGASSFQNFSITKNIGDATANKEWFFGFAFYPGNGSTANDNFNLDMYQDAAGSVIKLKYSNLIGGLEVSSNKGSTSLTVDNTFIFSPNTWYFIELNFIFSLSNTGKLIVRVNEGSPFVNLTNINLSYNQGGLPLSLYKIYLRCNTSSFTTAWKMDDMYLCDTSGSYNNSFLGDVRIDMINPSSAGNYSQLSPTSGDNYTCVDEEDFSNADYVQGSNPTDKDSYNYEDVPTDLDDANINAVVINSLAKRTSASDNIKIKNLVRKSSVDYKDATAKSLPDTEFVVPSILERDPSDNSAWTKAKINACEFGVEVN